jgi:hypothetical protein
MHAHHFGYFSGCPSRGKELAVRQNLTMGEVISVLARKSLPSGKSPVAGTRNGFPMLAPTGQVITSKLIRALQDSDE